MALRRAYWINDAEVWLGQQIYAVCYKHHLDRVPTNPDEQTTFFQYCARQRRGEQEGRAWEWGVEFARKVSCTGKIVIAEPEWEGGKLVDTVSADYYGHSLVISVQPVPFEVIKISNDPNGEPRGWVPEGYADPSHLWNHVDLRQR